MSDYYDHGAYPATGAAGRSSDARAEFDAIESGFDKLAPLAGNAFKISYVNAGATRWDAFGGEGLLKLRTAAVPIIATPGIDYLDPATAAVVTNKTIVVANNTITTAAHGTLAATELNAALAELVDDSAATYAPIASPTFTGDPKAPTAALGDNDTSIATTAFVTNAYANGFGGGGFSFKNLIINGDMRIAQRGTSTTASNTYFVDRWRTGAGVAAGQVTASRSSDASVSVVGPDHIFMLTTSTASVAAGDLGSLIQDVEGFNSAVLLWGTSSAKTITLSFRARATQSMTMSVSVRNGTGTRSYVTTVELTTTVQAFSITIPGDTSGTWPTDNTKALTVTFVHTAGTGNQTSTLNAWQAGNFAAANTQTNLLPVSGGAISVGDVQIELGSSATPFEKRPFGTELALCQRYYERAAAAYGATYPSAGVLSARALNFAASTQDTFINLPFKVVKRTTPTVSARYDVNDGAQADASAIANQDGFFITQFIASLGRLDLDDWQASAEL